MVPIRFFILNITYNGLTVVKSGDTWLRIATCGYKWPNFPNKVQFSSYMRSHTI